MPRCLLLFAHPRTDHSEANVPLLQSARRVEGVTVVDLYAEYPTFEIDIDREQERLVAHDVLVLQHPVYWYSCPALLKEWMDLVLEHGFAYGPGGTALAGKLLLNAVTCGARREAYSASGAYCQDLRGLFAPFEQTALLCGMRFLPPFALFAAGHAAEEGRLDAHAADYRRLLEALAEGRLDLGRAEVGSLLSGRLDELVAAPDRSS